jgi:hypothetical protein
LANQIVFLEKGFPEFISKWRGVKIAIFETQKMGVKINRGNFTCCQFKETNKKTAGFI